MNKNTLKLLLIVLGLNMGIGAYAAREGSADPVDLKVFAADRH